MAEHEQEEELTLEDVAFMANDKVDALIDLLIEKGVITEDEVVKKIDELYEDEDEEESETEE